MSETLLALLIPAIVGLVTGIIGALVAYKKFTGEARGIEAEAELDEAGAAQIIKNISLSLIVPLSAQIKAQDEKILSMTDEFVLLEKDRGERETKYMGILDKLRGRIDNLEAIVAVQGELLFILRSGADKLVEQLVGIGIEPLFTLEHDKVVELEIALSEAYSERRSSGNNNL